MVRRKGDHFYKKAKDGGFAARSVFKLEEIDNKHSLYKEGFKILDLGCAPGSWLQYAARKIGPSGALVGVDLSEVTSSGPNVELYQMDIFDLKVAESPLKEHAPFDFIQSDAMTKTTGIAEIDCARSIGLVEFALHLARTGGLKEDGNLLAKIFEGPGYQEFVKEFRSSFKKVQVVRPKATRVRSREVYLLGLGFSC